MTNLELKQEIKESGLCQWQVALEIGITEMSLIRWLREPERNERVKRIKTAIDNLNEKEAANNG